MNNRNKLKACGALLIILILNSCNWYLELNDYRNFAYDLQGTWVSNDPSIYSGKLIIDNSRITISGYSESQTPFLEDDNKRPFKGFTKGAALKGYSEDGKIFIEDGGRFQEGIPYSYYKAGSYPQKEFLRFTFNGRQEILQRQ